MFVTSSNSQQQAPLLHSQIKRGDLLEAGTPPPLGSPAAAGPSTSSTPNSVASPTGAAVEKEEPPTSMTNQSATSSSSAPPLLLASPTAATTPSVASAVVSSANTMTMMTGQQSGAAATASNTPPNVSFNPGLQHLHYHYLRSSGTLSPPLLPRTDPTVPPGCHEHGVALIGGKYLMLDQLEGSNLHRCIDFRAQQELACKTVNNDPTGQALLAAHYRVDGHPHINPVHEVLVGEKVTYLFFPPGSIDLHSYVRTRRRLREPQARHLFRQIVSAVHEAHIKGIVLRDLKLRKFVFTDESRTELKLESLEDAIVLEDEANDLLSDKHGCPAYVSPEILRSNAQYSGRAADMWGLGVMLYTMLVGRYPFHGQEHTGLFAKIRRGQFNLPDSISSRAKCLIRCLLRKEPEERLTTEDVLIHPWLTQASSRERVRRSGNGASGSESLDQTVPEDSNFASTFDD